MKYLPALLVLKVATARKKPPSNRNRREHFSRIVRRNSSSNEKKRSNDFRSEKKEVEKEHQESFLGKKGIEVKGCLLADTTQRVSKSTSFSMPRLRILPKYCGIIQFFLSFFAQQPVVVLWRLWFGRAGDNLGKRGRVSSI